ncbi:hypothetical protein PIB30_082305, partial [Stylosanthes scabra]|nr:hypothetical protein [Stylosanthes scabra]
MQGDPVRLPGYRWAPVALACMGLGENAIPRPGFGGTIIPACSSFLWTPYDEHRLGPNAGDETIRLAQGIPGEPRSLGAKHNECLTGPKGKNWWNEYRYWIGEWLNRVPAWHWNDPPPVGVPLDEYVTWHNGNYNAFLHLSAFDANQGQQGDSGGSEEEPEQPQQAYHAPYRSPTPVYMPASQIQEEQVPPPHESVPPPSSFPESSAQQLSSYPLFMNTV